jgi:hypothetical protein
MDLPCLISPMETWGSITCATWFYRPADLPLHYSHAFSDCDVFVDHFLQAKNDHCPGFVGENGCPFHV